MLELAGLEMKENCQIEELTLGEKKILFLIKLVADTSKQYIFQSLFQDMKENEVQSAVRLIVEMSTYMNVILLSSSSEGYEICDRVIQWSGNDGRGHISRSKIKDMCIMPPFVMRDILKVIRASETAEAVIPLWEVIPGEYEEYAHQVLNSNAGKVQYRSKQGDGSDSEKRFAGRSWRIVWIWNAYVPPCIWYPLNRTASG